MQANSERKQVDDATIRLRRIDGKLYREVPEHDTEAYPARMVQSNPRRSPWKTVFISLVVVAAVVLLLWWMTRTSANLQNIAHGVSQNGQALASQQHRLLSIQSGIAHIQSQIAALSSQIHASFAKLFGMLQQKQ